MKKRFTSTILVFSLILNCVSPVFAQDNNHTPKPYDKNELPQSVKDLRRFEIITLGSLPFVTLDTSLAYSTIRYAKNDFDSAYQPDIFSKTNYTQDEQLGIILTSVGISVGIGITDLVIQIIKRSSKKKREKRQMTYDDISIVPLSEDPDASQIPLPDTLSDEELDKVQGDAQSDAQNKAQDVAHNEAQEPEEIKD